MIQGLYIHIPFCQSICPYCDFSTWKANERQHRRWFNVIKKELQQRCLPKTSFNTLYFGGGTPSLISASLFKEVMDFLRDYLNLSSLCEITIEANPSGVDIEKLKLYQNCGITRVSLGVQSFQNHLLKVLGRTHNQEQVEKTLEMMSDFDFEVSLDLMFGMPLQRLEDLILDIKKAVKYTISHLSLYGLTIEPHTLFHQWREKKILPQIDEELYDTMYIKAVDLLEKEGLLRYEVSNFCRLSRYSLHNRNYWNGDSFLGLGSGACSFLNGYRMGNSKKFATYEKWVLNGCLFQDADFYEEIDFETEKREKIWLSLRQIQGLDLQKSKQIVSQDRLQKWIKKDYAMVDGDFFKIKGLGWLYLDDVVMDLWK